MNHPPDTAFSPAKPDVCLLVTTVPDANAGERIAEALVGERLAACVNIFPAGRSIYRWQGTVEREAEHVLLIKTRRSRRTQAQDRLIALHPYDVPECLALDPIGGHAPYLAWVEAQVDAG